jgi:putative flippase GtrA
MPVMSDIERRPNRTPRRARGQRAYQLVVVGGVAAAVTVVGIVLAAAGVVGFTIPVLAAVVAVICALLFRRTVSR